MHRGDYSRLPGRSLGRCAGLVDVLGGCVRRNEPVDRSKGSLGSHLGKEQKQKSQKGEKQACVRRALAPQRVPLYPKVAGDPSKFFQAEPIGMLSFG
jgi:hypothetical protein